MPGRRRSRCGHQVHRFKPVNGGGGLVAQFSQHGERNLEVDRVVVGHQNELTSGLRSRSPGYVFDRDLCRRDTRYGLKKLRLAVRLEQAGIKYSGLLAGRHGA